MQSAPSTTIAEQIGRQLSVISALRRILITHHALWATPLVWEVGDAGCRLVGKVSTALSATETRAVHAAWCEALGLYGQEHPASRTTRHLIATGVIDQVQVTLSATIHVDAR
jgi:hypothetical protein